MPKEANLTPQQERFCEEYLKDLNATRACERAGYKGNEKTLAATGSRLLRIDKVTVRCQEMMNARSERTKVDSDTILRELLKLATSDLRKLFQENGALKNPDEWPDDVAMAVAGVEVLEEFEGYGEDRTWIGYTKKVKFWDKPKALELLGKHLKLFTDKVEHSGKVTLEDLVAGSVDHKEGLKE